jgi:ATP-binding cassette, subfamily F, member 3
LSLVCRAESISRHYTQTPVFEDLSFAIYDGDRIGLVGPNGAGKSTLMQVLAGNVPPDSGVLRWSPDATSSLLRQIAEFPPGRTLLEEAHSAMAHLERAFAEMVEAGERMGTGLDDVERSQWAERYDQRQEFLNHHGGWEFSHRIEDVLFGLGFSEGDFRRPLETFSGGQRNRVLLAQLLLASPDLMLLDEPTNHLDVETIEWLEAYLARQDAAMIIVSHDRYFLDRTVKKVWELHAGKLSIYPGDYSSYAKLRAERQKVTGRIAAKQQEQIEHYEDFVRRNKAGQLAKQAKAREKMIARIEAERVETIADVVGPRMAFPEATRTGDIVLEAVDLGKEFPGKKLFSEFNLSIERGSRIGFLGPNGAGKTTLLRILLGEETPTTGSVKTGHNVKIGYLDQNLALLDIEATPLESVRPPWRYADKPEPFRALLARFGIGADMIDQKIKTLSGGERTRVALARLSAFEINVLALDEPTNHLDLWACESLESALAEFNGTILVVSHDRAFLSNVVDRLVYVADGAAFVIPGGYDRFLEYRAAMAAERAAASEIEKPALAPPKSDGKKRKRKFPYRKIEDIEADIADRESRIVQSERLLVSPEVYKDGRRVKEVQKQLAGLREEVARLYEHWEEASELSS